MKTIELQGKENPFLKGLCEDSLGPETSTKIPDQKTHRPEVKETHLLTLEHLREKLGQLDPLPGNRDTVGSHFALSFCHADPGGRHFGIRFLDCSCQGVHTAESPT